ncbi:FG-GAP-like repeat-containing protein [bacterium]|nr:FG-GAP-like repeat-containing protein [bacterium]
MRFKIFVVNTALSLTALFVIQSCTMDQPTLTWTEENGYRWAELPVARSGKAGFNQLSESETGIDFINHLTKDQIMDNRVLLNGSGVAIGDVDGDGLSDLYFCRLDGPNVLYKNLGNFNFVDITDSAGVACAGQFSAGVAMADVDGDTDLDLLVTAVGGPNACFLNDGTGKFVDATRSSGISYDGGPASMTLADIEGDGDLDLYIANYKRKSAKDIWDPGELVFQRIVETVGNSQRIAPKYQDHFVLDIRGPWALFFETGEPDFLFVNDGQGHFEKVTLDSGRFLDEDGTPVSELKDWGLMARFQDMDDDGDPDIYVCNDFESPDRIWINDGSGRFQAIPKLAIRNTSNSSMAVDFSDIDADGDQDFMVVDMLSLQHFRRMTQKNTEVPLPHPIGEIDNRPQYMKNTLFLNNGDNTYSEIANFSNVPASEWSWSNLFLDVDLDGYEDMLVATGHYYDAQDHDAMAKAASRIGMSAMSVEFSKTDDSARDENDKLSTVLLFPRLELPNVAFRNRGDLTFEEVGKAWGFATDDISHGMALGDLDNDGDRDVVINRLGLPAVVHRNESNAPRVAIRLRGVSPNTQGIGARIKVLGGPVPQNKEVTSGGAYLSSSEPMYSFAAGKSTSLTIEVRWRNGSVSTLTDVKPNHIYEIYESHAVADSFTTTESDIRPFFEDASHLIDHKHHEDPFDDFPRQPLLPNRLSTLGPGLAWYDVDSDGDDDLFIASGKGGKLAFFRNDGTSGFRQVTNGAPTENTNFDQSTVLGWTRSNETTLLVAHSNYEASQAAKSFVLGYHFSSNHVSSTDTLSFLESSVGPVAMADYDNDGDLDLLMAGGTIPARYPEPASARLYRNQGGTFELDSTASAAFDTLGLISGVVFSDLDADGDADLVFGIEWGPVKVFYNDEGSFTDATTKSGLQNHHGRWQGVTTGDLDEDGRLDIIATNWGLNSKYEHRYDDQHPLELFYADFDNNGRLEVIEAYFDPYLQTRMPERNLLAMLRGLPFIRMRMPNHSKYARSTLQEIIGPKLLKAGRLKTNTLAHMIFFNRGDRFEAVPMPSEAQFSTAFGVNVADFDGDGHDDVFISQNFFAVQVETPRSDAGRGLWLRGDGTGRLVPVPARESGIEIYGEQRGAAVGDYDQDGRVDLAVSQNASRTKLYRNVGAKPGLRVRLVGPAENSRGIGATVRLVYEGANGPAREVHSGSGYWSQDSVIPVMGLRENVKRIWVRWPGGKITERDISSDQREVTIRYDYTK